MLVNLFWTFFSVSAPLLVGLCVYRATAGDLLGVRLLMAAASALHGCFIPPAVIWLCDQFGFSGAIRIAIVVTGSIGIVCFATLAVFKLRVRPFAPMLFINSASTAVRLHSLKSAVLLGLIAYLSSVVLVDSYISLATPTMGWDVLDHWAHYAVDFIRTADGTDEAWWLKYKHPITMNLYLSWVGSLNATEGAFFGVGTFAWLIFPNAGWGLIFGLLVITQPLLENHALVIGYTELPLTCIWIVSLGLMAAWLYTGRKSVLVWSLVTICLSFTLRNSGGVQVYVFFAALIANLILFRILRGNAGFMVILVGVTLSIFILALLFGYSDLYDGGLAVNFAGKNLLVVALEPIDLFFRELQSRVHNSSYGLGFCSVVVLAGLTLKSNSQKQHIKQKSVFVFLYVAFAMYYASTFAMYFLDYSQPFTGLDSDTLYSRLSLPVMSVPFLVLPLIASKCLSVTDHVLWPNNVR